ncbi:MAG: isoprenylcysteine carboxylmethyltransferase family protein [Xanthobacteraceae bacterium]|nr:isoprenylcysteine carboxylmethyltransferase family protein [Xanthobacteraceae bacterium]
MTTRVNRTSRALFANRTKHTRWLAVLLLPLVAVITPPARPEWVGDALESAGIVCLVICLVGRGWTSVYIAGRKNTELVVAGPYSIVRNPLYVFSFIDLIGIGLISEVMTILAVSLVVFVIYYAFVVRREEAHIAAVHGKAFLEYKKRVPRWFPDFSKWKDARRLEVEPRRILNHLVDSSLCFLAFLFFEMLDFLRAAKLIPLQIVLQ